MGQLWVIAAPSGAGKTSLVNALANDLSSLRVSVSHTTRPPRPGEVQGENYFFITPAEFETMIEDFGTKILHWTLRNEIGFGETRGNAKKSGWKVVYQDDTAVIYKRK